MLFRRRRRRSDSFIRPIRFFSIMMDNEIVEGELFGVKSSNLSYGHRMDSYEPFIFNDVGDYFCKLDKKVKFYIINKKYLELFQKSF